MKYAESCVPSTTIQAINAQINRIDQAIEVAHRIASANLDWIGWLIDGYVAIVILVLMALFRYTPALRNQIAPLEKDGPDSAAYRSAAARQNLIGALFIVPLLLILYLMVFKPIT